MLRKIKKNNIKFKIDFIVWKSSYGGLLYKEALKFKIDFIVWKLVEYDLGMVKGPSLK